MSNTLDELQKYNINQKDIQKLKDIGINSIQGLYMTSRKNLLNIKGFNEKKIKNIFNEANKIEVYGLFQKGSTLMNERDNNIFKISTTSKNIDNILGGGIESSSLTEIIGERNTGKTDFVHILCVSAQKINPSNKIIFIDFDKTFISKKVIGFAKALNMKKKKVADNILLINDIDNYEQLIKKLDEITEKIHKGEYCLLIVESLISLFQKYFEEKISNNSQSNNFEIKFDIESKLGQILIKLKNMALLFNIAVIISRRININNDSDEHANNYDLINYDQNIEIILGNECQTRFKLKRIKNGKIKCILLNSPMMPEKDCKFIINEKGIVDC